MVAPVGRRWQSPRAHDAADHPGGYNRRVDPTRQSSEGESVTAALDGTIRPPTEAATLPQRYMVRCDDTGWYLTCLEAPNVAVRLDRRTSVTAQAARRASAGTIYLDGAAQCEPFLDTGRRVYNLDHHEGCVRPFTLATCEQALVLVRKGLDLRAGEWTVICGEPDLDTVLAIWVLLNHARLFTQDPRVRNRVIPLIRVEGAIDALGFDLLDLTGLPEELVVATQATIDRLRARELALKRDGTWSDSDPAEYAVAVLREIDKLVYSPEDFTGLTEVEELGRVALRGDRIAVLCRSEVGIYETERHLRRVHSERVGIILLQKNSSTYTLRQVDPFLHAGLAPLYDRLNQLDPAVTAQARWGGSSDIGGSPRDRGTRLQPEDLLEVCRRVYRPSRTRGRFARLVQVVALAGAAALLAGLAGGSGIVAAFSARFFSLGPARPLDIAAVVALLAVAILGTAARRFPRAFGLRLPHGLRWMVPLLPLVVIAAVAGGAWTPVPVSLTLPPGGAGRLAFASLALAAACELLFRGALHGLLADVWPAPGPPGAWRLSPPVVVCALLSAAAWPVLMPIPFAMLSSPYGIVLAARFGIAGIGLGLACGLARERSGSVLAPLALHAAAAAGVWPVLLAAAQHGP